MIVSEHNFESAAIKKKSFYSSDKILSEVKQN